MESYFDTLEPKDCCGCGACAQICPVNCIDMDTNEEGFFYPTLFKDKCISCNKCKDVCPFNDKAFLKVTNEPLSEYAAYATSEYVLQNSSSGGIFSCLAKFILDNSGKVYGACFDESNRLMHAGIDSLDSLDALRKSKYIQSKTNGIFKEAQKDLNAGKKVLFVGTPCQIAGLKLFLDNEYDDLYTLDFVCHGVPSQLMFDEYVKYLEKKHKGKLTYVDFRDKTKYGWSITLRYDIVSEKKSIMPYVIPRLSYAKEQPSIYIKKAGLNTFYTPQKFSSYFSGFLAGYTQRESCYNCKYASLNRPSDITLADFWGFQRMVPEVKNEKGLSLALVNTHKGEEVFKQIDDLVWRKKLTKSQAYVKENYNLYRSTVRQTARNIVYKELIERGFSYIAEKHFRPPDYFIELIKHLIPNNAKKALKRMLFPR